MRRCAKFDHQCKGVLAWHLVSRKTGEQLCGPRQQAHPVVQLCQLLVLLAVQLAHTTYTALMQEPQAHDFGHLASGLSKGGGQCWRASSN